jgi:hypothetical protein
MFLMNMTKEKDFEKKASFEKNIVEIDKNLRDLKEFYLLFLSVLSQGGDLNEKESKNN